jgi:hypothetical protein
MATRINGSELKKNIGVTIRLIGTVMSSNGQIAQIRSSDEQVINVQLGGATPYYPDDIVEIVGQVRQNLTIEEYQSISFGKNFGI